MSAVGDEAGRLGAEVTREQPHQCRHFVRRSLPVVSGEGEQGQRADAEPRCRLDEGAHPLRSGAMAGGAGKAPARGPAPVAVHDHGDVKQSAGRHQRSRVARIRASM
jgi:hypothetical protein